MTIPDEAQRDADARIEERIVGVLGRHFPGLTHGDAAEIAETLRAELGLRINRREHHTCARGAEPQKRWVTRWEPDPERECPCAKWNECWHLDAYRCARGNPK